MIKIKIILSVVVAILMLNTAFAETKVAQADIALFCRIEGWMDIYELRGERISEYAERNVAIFKTSNPQVFIVKDGLFDGNGRGVFLLIEEWKAFQVAKGNSIQFISTTNPKQKIAVQKNGTKLSAFHSTGLPASTECTSNKYEVPEFWN